jgi:putative glutamine amidotransferase
MISPVLISMRVTEESRYDERRSAIAYDYIEFLQRVGFTPFPIPVNIHSVEPFFQKLEPVMVFLSGGNSIDEYDSDDFYPERDETEKALVDMAVERGIPILGICIGAQYLNRYYGGGVATRVEGHVAATHIIDSPLEIFDGRRVNSFHSYAIANTCLSSELHPLAYAEDGTVEAFRHVEKPVYGVMWHPERDESGKWEKMVDSMMKGEL